MSILDADGPAFDPLNAIGPIAKLEDVARQALNREVLIDGANDAVLGLEKNSIVGSIWNSAAGGQRGRSRAASCPQHVMDAVAVNQRAVAASACRESFRQHA